MDFTARFFSFAVVILSGPGASLYGICLMSWLICLGVQFRLC